MIKSRHIIVLLLIVLSGICIVSLDKIIDKNNSIENYKIEIDSLETIIQVKDNNLARCSNRLSYWEMYANSYQYQSEIEKCELIKEREKP